MHAKSKAGEEIIFVVDLCAAVRAGDQPFLLQGV